MKPGLLEQVVEAVLYEGYVLYPYRPSAKKNRKRFTFGLIYPEAYSQAQRGVEPCLMQTECLLRSTTDHPTLGISVRFLHPLARQVGRLSSPATQRVEGREPDCELVPELRVDGELFQCWHEAVEREVNLPQISFLGRDQRCQTELGFSFAASRRLEPIRDGRQQVVGALIREQNRVEGIVEVRLQPIAEDWHRVTVRVANRTALPEGKELNMDGIILRAFASTHTILQAQGAEFASLTDPPPEVRSAAVACRNLGTWPVLIGDEDKQERDTMLSSPIILYDYPKIASESPGAFFDGTEIDEMLALRVLTLAEEEKREMRQADVFARQILERTEAMPEDQWARLHGTIRDLGFFEEDSAGENRPLEGIWAGGVYLRPGDRVRLRPKARADIMDLALNGQIARIEAVEQDAENRIHLAVVVEADPGKDLGLLRQPGHRFFYGVDEVEPVKAESEGEVCQSPQKS